MNEIINPKYPRGVEVVVGVIIENPKGEILLVKSPKWGNKWTIPGGHVDAGESITQAVIREAKEETSLSGSEILILDGDELVDHAWETPKNALDYDFRRGLGNTISEFIEFKKTAKISQNYLKA